MVDLELLKKISSEDGISSFEEPIAKCVKAQAINNGYTPIQDKLGSTIIPLGGDDTSCSIMIAAHMDEVGFMVTDIDDKGFVKGRPIGSWWSHMLLGQWFTITTKASKKYPTLVGSMATHGLPASIKEKTVKIEDIYFDLGVKNKEEVESLGIEIGNMITPQCHFQIMNDEKYISNKAFDDRIGTYILMELCKELKGSKHVPVYLAHTVQEEPGLRGARTATHTVHPKIAFAIDTTLAGDTPMNHNICALGDGVVLSMIDSNSLASRTLVKYTENICKAKNIKHQYAVFNLGGTDAGNIHKTYEGIVTMTLSIPIRYMHTNHSMIHLDDVEACIRLLKEICLDMNEEKYMSLL